MTQTTIVGCGYVGYPLALLAAEAGHAVLAVDLDEGVVDAVNAGVALGAEPGVEALAHLAASSGRLKADLRPGYGEIFVLAVGTPLDDATRTADLGALVAAAESIVPWLAPGNLVIVESTVPPGTCDGVVLPILERSGLRVGDDLLLAHCPERVHPGTTVHELRSLDRIIGGFDGASTEAVVAFYETFVQGTLHRTDLRTAEVCKLMENTFRDVTIALTNEVAGIAESMGVDPLEAIRLANGHPRVNYLEPGIGVGGHCIPIDPWFLVDDPERGGLIGAGRAVNDARPLLVADRIAHEVSGTPDVTVVLFGATYKPDVDDVRNAPAGVVRDELVRRGLVVRVYDPMAPGMGGELIEVLEGADLAAVLVPHRAMVDDLRGRRADLSDVMRTPQWLDFSSGTARDLS